jgi:gluconolactonase
MIFVDGLAAPETPRLSPTERAWLCVEMHEPRGGVTRLSDDGSRVSLVAHTGQPNGLAVDLEGVIWIANCLPAPALLRLEPRGQPEVFLDTVEGQAMLLPNDLCFGPDGRLYLTDSGMLISDWLVDGDIRPDHDTAPFDGRLYRIDPVTSEAHIVDRGIRFANGIAFGPDGHLYVNEMITGDIFRYRFDGGQPGPREPFANVMAPKWDGGFRGPDGMGFGRDGRLYCTVFGEGAVAVVGPDGTVEARLRTEGSRPTNLAWGRDGDRHIYVTEIEHGRIERHETPTTGLPLYYGGSESVAL